MTETWRPIPESNGLYEVSDQGRVRSLKFGRTQVMRSQTSNAIGHQKLDLMIDSRRCPRWVHRLVLEAFVGPCPPGQQVRHLDGDASHNALTNLTYGTPSENVQDILRHGRHSQANQTHCIHGHEFTPENTIVTPRQRRCRKCAQRWIRNRNEQPVVCEDCGRPMKRGSLRSHRRLWCKKKADAETKKAIEARVKALEAAALGGDE
jgi:hypothetical protein